MSKNRDYSLKGLFQNYPNILIDTSSIFSNGFNLGSEYSLKDKLNSIENRIKCLKIFESFIDSGGNLMVTPPVFEEYCNFYDLKYSYRKSVKRLNQRLSRDKHGLNKSKHSPLVNINRKIRELIKQSECFKSKLEEGRILSFDNVDVPLYYDLEKKYLDLIEDYNLSFTDFDLIISSIIIAKNSGKTALISNDLNLRKSLKDVIFSEQLSSADISCFLKVGYSTFIKSSD